MKKLLILTGPQGSGNHMWSKIFSLHPDVYGWRDLTETYWIGHDREPFNEYWRNPQNLKDFNWNISDYYLTSISVPYMENGAPTIPRIKEFVAEIEQQSIQVTIGIIGRDRNILSMQEKRLRGGETFNTAIDLYKELPIENVYFLSHELLILYRQQYLNKIASDLEFPIDIDNNKIEEILSDNANEKYLRPIEGHWVDNLARQSSTKWK